MMMAVPAMVVVPTAPMMVVVPAAPVMMMPTHFRRHLLFAVLLQRRRSARIDQRHRLCTFDGSRDQKQRADSRKAQNFRSVHHNSPYVRCHAGDARLPLPATVSPRRENRI
jgi:hypothetical protein